MILRPGTFLQDRYEILDQIGSGGMSVVYKAKCHKLNRLVAVKVLKEEFINDSNFVSKFKMEAQAAAGLSHPNIVSVYDVIDEGKLHYIVMELIEGITLKSYIVKKGKLETKESIGIAIQVAQGIEAAHEQHIIHRDIKPQNMIISRDGKVKVADFGIARAVSAQTLTSAAMGSVHYISPEQARGGYSDARSDIYSLGITMYEMVTGKLPFDGENTVAIALAHLEDVVVPPSVYSPEMPAGLEKIILKCAEKKPERRYDSANDVIADLRKVLMQPEGEFVKNAGNEPTGSMKAGITSGSAASEGGNADAGVLDGATIHISDDEMSQIKERKRPPVSAETEVKRPEREVIPAQKPANHQPGNGKKKRPDPEDDVNTNIERLFASAGVIAAIIIVAVMIVVVSKVTGVFQFRFSDKEMVTTAVTEAAAEDLTLDNNEVQVPNVCGKPEANAGEMLTERGLLPKYEYEFFDDVEAGYVAKQKPEEGEVMSRGEQVILVVSNGSDKIDLTELKLDQLDGATAKKVIESRQLVVQMVSEENETIAAGKVIRVDPLKAASGETIVLYVSTGPHVDTVAVPQLTGITEEEAIAMLAEVGLVPGNTTTEEHDTIPRGSIIRQSGGTNGVAEPGSKIDYVVSSGPEEVKQQRYVASIKDTYDLSSLIGPGAGSSSITVMVRLHQVSADGSDIYKTLTDTVTISGSVLLPISYTSIESMNGSDYGEVQVVDVESQAVLKSYPLAFFPMD